MGEMEERAQRDINYGIMWRWHQEHRFVRETTLFGKPYHWYVEIETGKAVLVGPVRR